MPTTTTTTVAPNASVPIYTTGLQHIDSVFQTSFYNEIQDNLVEWLDWGLLEKGNYFNTTKDETSPEGFDYSLLSLSNNDNFSAGQAWDGFRSNWVWQSGITPPDGMDAPIVGENNAIPGISGVYVDDTFYPSDTTGDYAHHVDYYNGRVVFDSPIPTGSKVQAEFSYKYINVVYANSLPWVREARYRSLIGDHEDILPPEMTVNMPFIAVEVSNRRTKPFALGGHQSMYTDVLFHCVAENEYTRNQLLDIVSSQSDQILTLFNSNSVINSGDTPIQYNGVPNSGAMRYPDLVCKYKFCTARLNEITCDNAMNINSNVYLGIAKVTTEILDFTST